MTTFYQTKIMGVLECPILTTEHNTRVMVGQKQWEYLDHILSVLFGLPQKCLNLIPGGKCSITNFLVNTSL